MQASQSLSFPATVTISPAVLWPPGHKFRHMALTNALLSWGGVGSCAAKRFAKDGTRTSEVTVTCCDTTNSVCDDTPEVLDVAGHKPVDHT